MYSHRAVKSIHPLSIEVLAIQRVPNEVFDSSVNRAGLSQSQLGACYKLHFLALLLIST